LTVNRLLSDEWALGAAYKFTQSELHQDLVDLPDDSISPYARVFRRSELHTFSCYLLYSHPSGFFARTDLAWYLQQNQTQALNVPAARTGDDFPQLNLWIGWRLGGAWAIFRLACSIERHRLQTQPAYRLSRTAA